MIGEMKIGFLLALLACISGCGVKAKYNLTGANTNAKTFQVNYFQNFSTQSQGSTFEPGMDRDFTLALQERILKQANLNLVGSNGDLLYEGEIVEYPISPMGATAQQNAVQNRLSVGVAVRFYNKIKEDADFERRFSFFYDFPANIQLVSVKDEAHTVIFERITQDIFNTSLANW